MSIQELRNQLYNDIIEEHSHLQLDPDLIEEMIEERIMWIRMSLQQ